MERDLKGLPDRAREWPDEAKAELEAAAEAIEARMKSRRPAGARGAGGKTLREIMLDAPKGDWKIERASFKAKVRSIKL